MNQFARLLSLGLLGILWACQSPNTDLTPTPTAEPFPIGPTTGPLSSFTVTTAGGTFRSPDQTVTLTFPAGAVNEPTVISMQPVEGTCPAGIGPSLRLLPHDIRFTKPVMLRFSYAHSTLAVNTTQALGLAYQDQAGYWRLAANPTIDPVAKTVSVQTTHFSDWVTALWFRLLPASATVSEGEKLALEVVTYAPLVAPLTPPTEQDIALGNPVIAEAVAVKNGGQGDAWQLGGPGQLIANGAKAMYQAPASVTEPNVVNVSVELSTKGVFTTEKHMLVSTITVMPKRRAGIMYRINGGPYRFIPALLDIIGRYYGENHYGVAASDNDARHAIEIHWLGGTGTHVWNYPSLNPPPYYNSLLGATDDYPLIQSYYLVGPRHDAVASGGYIKVDKLEGNGKELSGSFSVTQAGVTEGGIPVTTINIDGYFYGIRAD